MYLNEFILLHLILWYNIVDWHFTQRLCDAETRPARLILLELQRHQINVIGVHTHPCTMLQYLEYNNRTREVSTSVSVPLVPSFNNVGIWKRYLDCSSHLVLSRFALYVSQPASQFSTQSTNFTPSISNIDSSKYWNSALHKSRRIMLSFLHRLAVVAILLATRPCHALRPDHSLRSPEYAPRGHVNAVYFIKWFLISLYQA